MIIPELEVITESHAPPAYQLVGKRYSVLNVPLPPGGTFISEPGAMMHMSSDVKMQAVFGGLMGAFNNMASGEGSFARVKYTASANGYVGLTPNMPMAVVVPVDLDAVGGVVNAKRGAYMAGPETVSARVQILPARSLAACCCGGLPPLIQALHGSGTAFLAAGGTVVKKSLQPGEKFIVDSDSVVAFSPSVGYDVVQVGTCITCCFGGERCFNTALTGPGDIYLQSMSYEKLIKFLVKSTGGGDNKKKDDKQGAPAASDMMCR